MVRPLISLATAVTLLAGCSLYGGDDDCSYGGGGAEGAGEGNSGADYYDPGLRNPETGSCEYYGGGGGSSCDACGNCPPQAEEPDRLPAPTWGFCESQCTGLAQDACEAASGCRAIFASDCATQRCEDTPVYAECWSTDMTGPVQGGGCDGLDVYACSQHDDCSAVHQRLEIPPGDNEPGFSNAIGNFGYCIGEGGEVTDVGDCYGPVNDDQVDPGCPEGTLPGIRNGEYTGYCIPMDQCEDAPACQNIEAEPTCVGRPDCTPLYQGIDCQCTGDSCTCAEWQFVACE